MKTFTSEVQSVTDHYNEVVVSPNASKTFEVITPDSANSTRVSFTVGVDSNTLLSRRIALEVPIKLECVHTAPTNVYGLVLRSFPLSSIITNCTVIINNRQYSVSPQDLRFTLQRFKDSQQTACPTQLDHTRVLANAGQNSRSPFAVLFNDGDEQQSRRAFQQLAAQEVGDTATATTVSATYGDNALIEIPFHPLFSEDVNECFSNIREFKVNILFDNDLTKCMCRHVTLTLADTSTTVTIPNPTKMRLHVVRVSPPDDFAMPMKSITLLKDYQVSTHKMSSLAAGDSRTERFNDIKLSVIPSRVFVYTKDETYVPTLGDYSMEVESVNFTVGNRSGQCSGASKEHLYQLAKREGLNDRYHEFASNLNGVGSYLCFNFAEEFGLVPGSRTDTTFRGTITFVNNTTVPLAHLLYFVFEYDAVLETDGFTSNLLVGLSDDVVDSVEMNTHQGELVQQNVEGGSLRLGGKVQGGGFKSFMRGFGRGVGIAGMVSSPLGYLIPQLKPVSAGLTALGKGTQMLTGGAVQARPNHGKKSLQEMLASQ